MLREDCDLIFDETAGPGVVADASNPWIIHVSVVVHDEPENYAKYKRWKTLEGTAQRHAPGFIKRLLVQSQSRPNHFYYTSWWEAEHCAHDFSAGDDFKRLFAAYSPVGVFAVPQVLEHCDVVFDELAESAQ
jgi:heme-degrading monooxygenase HmoA